MSKTLFISQESMESLVSRGKVDLSGVRLKVNGTTTSYRITPAVKILGCESSPGDPLKISSKFIPLTLLDNAGADVYLTSITLEGHSYLVDHGYLCENVEQHPAQD